MLLRVWVVCLLSVALTPARFLGIEPPLGGFTFTTPSFTSESEACTEHCPPSAKCSIDACGFVECQCNGHGEVIDGTLCLCDDGYHGSHCSYQLGDVTANCSVSHPTSLNAGDTSDQRYCVDAATCKAGAMYLSPVQRTRVPDLWDSATSCHPPEVGPVRLSLTISGTPFFLRGPRCRSYDVDATATPTALDQLHLVFVPAETHGLYTIHAVDTRSRTLTIDYASLKAGALYVNVSFTDHEVVAPTRFSIDFSVTAPTIRLADNTQYRLTLHPMTKALVATDLLGATVAWKLLYRDTVLPASTRISTQLIVQPTGTTTSVTGVWTAHQCFSHCIRLGGSCGGYMLNDDTGVCLLYEHVSFTVDSNGELGGDDMTYGVVTPIACPLYGLSNDACTVFQTTGQLFGVYTDDGAYISFQTATTGADEPLLFNENALEYVGADPTDIINPDTVELFKLRQVASSECEFELHYGHDDSYAIVLNATGTGLVSKRTRAARRVSGNAFFVLETSAYTSTGFQLVVAVKSGSRNRYVGFVGVPEYGDVVQLFDPLTLPPGTITASRFFTSHPQDLLASDIANYRFNGVPTLPYERGTTVIATIAHYPAFFCIQRCLHHLNCTGASISATGTCVLVTHSQLSFSAGALAWTRQLVYAEELVAAGLTSVARAQYMTNTDIHPGGVVEAVSYAPITAVGRANITHGDRVAALQRCKDACTEEQHYECLGFTFEAGSGLCYLLADGFVLNPAYNHPDNSMFAFRRSAIPTGVDGSRVVITTGTVEYDVVFEQEDPTSANVYALGRGDHPDTILMSISGSPLGPAPFFSEFSSQRWLFAVMLIGTSTLSTTEGTTVAITAVRPHSYTPVDERTAFVGQSLCNTPDGVLGNHSTSAFDGTATCLVTTCPYATSIRDCNADVSDGCETDILTDLDNCGTCGHACPEPDVYPVIGNVACTSGVCVADDCAVGFTGSACEININDCASLPCQHDGVCTDMVNGYTCVCPWTFAGTLCEVTTHCDAYYLHGPGLQLTGDGSPAVACTSCYLVIAFWANVTTGHHTLLNVTQMDAHRVAVVHVNDSVSLIDSTSWSVTYPTRLSHGIWHHYILAFHASVLDFYVDGIPALSGITFGGALGDFGITQLSSDADIDDLYVFSNVGIDDADAMDLYAGAEPWAGTETRLAFTFDAESRVNTGDVGTAFTMSGGTIAGCGVCASSPCQNDGMCHATGPSSYVCTCADGYDGTNCQNRNECTSLPCQNGATCVDGTGSFHCTCLLGYSGALCQTNIDECASAPCGNGGTCVDSTNGFTCICPAGVSGARCQTPINECASHPCQNGATCVDGSNGLTCTCRTGYSGVYCQTNINDCASTPCMNGATCVDGLGSYTCVCDALSSGFYCQKRKYCDDYYLLTAANGDADASISPVAAVTTTSNFTAMLWTRYARSTASTVFPFAMLDAEPSGNWGIRLELPFALNKPRVLMPSCTSSAIVFDAATVTASAGFNVTDWHHYAVVYAAPRLHLYVDGIAQLNGGVAHYTCPGTSETVESAPLTFGAHTYVDGFRWSTTDLTAAQVRAAAGSDTYPSELESTVAMLFDFTSDSLASSHTNTGTYPAMALSPLTGTATIAHCHTCSDGACQHGATCTDLAALNNNALCTCASGYTGSLCEININDCASLPCRNGGTCNDGVNSWTCTCVPGFVGTRCQTEVIECASAPCQNGGVCTDATNGYTCVCPAGYSGAQCQTDINECASAPCQNGAPCTDYLNSYDCACTAGYEGAQCEININECDNLPCMNGATCHDGVNEFWCECDAYSNGTFCQERRYCDRDYLHVSANGAAETMQNPDPGVSLRTDRSFTVMLWTRSAKATPGTVYPFAMFDAEPSGEWGIRLELYSWTAVAPIGIRLASCETNPVVAAPDGVVASAGYNNTDWHHLAITYAFEGSAHNLYLFIDGIHQFIGTSPFRSAHSCAGTGESIEPWPLEFGANTDVDAFLWYTAPLTFNDIRAIAAHDVYPLESAAFMALRFDFTSGLLSSTQYANATYQTVQLYNLVAPTVIEHCYTCSDNPCQHGATCANITGTPINSALCTCLPGYSGSLCQTDTNECASHPCINLGTCTDALNGYSCACVAGYSGVRCQTNINECASAPCTNGGTCTDGVNGYSCACAAGYSGTRCQTNINECASLPCMHGATCHDGLTSYVCQCLPGFTDTFCQTEINECASMPCKSGGTCSDQINGFVCNCVAGFSGAKCQLEINECLSLPCQNSGTCTDFLAYYECTCPPGVVGTHCDSDLDECSSKPCRNGGACTDMPNAFHCACNPGYSGVLCETNINECTSMPCQHGGTCNDNNNAYTCACVAGYTMSDCSMEINECQSLPCEHSGVCTDLLSGYTCACQPGYSGVRCQTDINECVSAPCTNGGTCTDAVNGFTCACTVGWAGARCQSVDECLSVPCQNGGTCVDGTNAFTCTCASGWTGSVCQDIDECASHPCQNGAMCVDGVGSFICLCTGVYYDDFCDAAAQCPRWSPTKTTVGNENTYGSWMQVVDGGGDNTAAPKPIHRATVLLGGQSLTWPVGGYPMMLTFAVHSPGGAGAYVDFYAMTVQRTATTTVELGCISRNTSANEIVTTTFSFDMTAARWRDVGCAWQASTTVYLYVDGVETTASRVSSATPPLYTGYVLGRLADSNTDTSPLTTYFAGQMLSVIIDEDWVDASTRANIFGNNMNVNPAGIPQVNNAISVAIPFNRGGAVDDADYGNPAAGTDRVRHFYWNGASLDTSGSGIGAPTYTVCAADPSPACEPNYSGPLCDQANLCASSPCLNGGTCSKRNNGYACYCTTGYTGAQCQTPP